MRPLFRCYDPQCPKPHRMLDDLRFCNTPEIDTSTKGWDWKTTEDDGDWIEITDGSGHVLGRIKAGSITADKIQSGSITSGKIHIDISDSFDDNTFTFRAEQNYAMTITPPDSFMKITFP